MDKPHFVYVIYIATSPEKLWNALIDEAREEKQSRVTFKIDPIGDVVRLTVTHRPLLPTRQLRGVSPAVLQYSS